MQLYATIESERASKGQGGNKFLEFRLNAGGKENSQRVLYLRIDKVDEGYHLIVTTPGEHGEKRVIDEILTKAKS